MTQTQLDRLNRLAPMEEGGKRIPRYVRCYSNAGTPSETLDCYTVVYSGRYAGRYGVSRGVSMNSAPFSPCGIGQHFEYERHQLGDQWEVDRPKYSHLGKKIRFADLPIDCQTLVWSDYQELWGLPEEEGN